MPKRKKPAPPAREAQLAYLAALGVTDPPPELSLADARKLIEEAIARGGPGGTQRGPAPDGQIERILELGGSPWDDISKGQASRLIAFLCERQPVCPKCSHEARATDARCPGCGSLLSPCPVPHPGPDELPQAATDEAPDEMGGDLAIDGVNAAGDAHAADEVDATDELRIADEVQPADEVGSAVGNRAAEAAHAADEVDATDELRIADEVQPAGGVGSAVDGRAAEAAHAAGEVDATDELRIADEVRPADEARAPPRPDRPVAAPGVCPYCGAMTDVPSGAVTVNCSGCHRLYPAEPLGQRKGWLGGLFRSGR